MTNDPLTDKEIADGEKLIEEAAVMMRQFWSAMQARKQDVKTTDQAAADARRKLQHATEEYESARSNMEALLKGEAPF